MRNISLIIRRVSAFERYFQPSLDARLQLAASSKSPVVEQCPCLRAALLQ